MTETLLSGLSKEGPNLSCDLCAKTYDRHDLLVRHRRRCYGPKATNLRRKACDSCVRAKARCSYSQPTCSRCIRRGKPCVYLTPSASSISGVSRELDNWTSTGSLNSNDSQVSLLESTLPLEPAFDIDALDWGISHPSPSFNPIDLSFTAMFNPSAINCLNFAVEQSSMNNVLDQHQDPFASTRSLNSQNGSASIPVTASSISSSDMDSAFDPVTLISIMKILCEYSSLLSNDSYFSPFLHRSMYSVAGNVGLDMAFLPLTAMAICCGSTIKHSPDKMFFKRVMDAARRKLIQEFPTHECLGQWDALHAMLIYESIDLRESMNDDSDGWRVARPIRGMGSPFLLKMVERHASILPQLRNPDISAFSEPTSCPCTLAESAWDRWKVTEKVRRTIFFANMLNFYNNYDQSARRLSAYYTALDDALILNMPLPCSEVAWSARNGEDWTLAMSKTSVSQTNSSISGVPFEDLLSTATSLKEVFGQLNKEQLQKKIGSDISLNNSTEFRRLVILCAIQQFL